MNENVFDSLVESSHKHYESKKERRKPFIMKTIKENRNKKEKTNSSTEKKGFYFFVFLKK